MVPALPVFLPGNSAGPLYLHGLRIGTVAMARYPLRPGWRALAGWILLRVLSAEAGADDQVHFRYARSGSRPRMTLMQWSYGNGLEGGAPGPDEPLVADRPDFTEASVTVGRGVAQLEFGYTYTLDQQGSDGHRSHSYPESLLRVGVLAEWLELRVGYNYADQTSRSGAAITSESGSEDLSLGLKIALTPQDGILPEMALLPQMSVPTGSRAFSAAEVLPGVNWVYSWEINDLLSVAGSTQGNGAIDDATGKRYWEVGQSLVVGRRLAERIGAYTEWYALFPYSADTARPMHFFNGGFTLLVNNDWQLDVRAGLGLNEAADDYFIGAGSVIRF